MPAAPKGSTSIPATTTHRACWCDPSEAWALPPTVGKSLTRTATSRIVLAGRLWQATDISLMGPLLSIAARS